MTNKTSHVTTPDNITYTGHRRHNTHPQSDQESKLLEVTAGPHDVTNKHINNAPALETPLHEIRQYEYHYIILPVKPPFSFYQHCVMQLKSYTRINFLHVNLSQLHKIY